MSKLTKSQENVVNRQTSRLLVSAGAGAGKTKTLTSRIINLLSIKDKDGNRINSISSLVVLTFTNSAQKEMKDRIKAALIDLNDPQYDFDIAHIDEAYIDTFDSFCNKIVKKFSSYSNLPEILSIGSENIFSMALSKIVEEVCLYEYSNGPDFIKEFIKGFGNKYNNKFESFIEQSYKAYTCLIDTEDEINNYESKYFKEEFIKEKEREYINECKILARKLKSFKSERQDLNDYFVKFHNLFDDIISAQYLDDVEAKIPRPHKDFLESLPEDDSVAFAKSLLEQFTNLKSYLTTKDGLNFSVIKKISQNYINLKELSLYVNNLISKVHEKYKAFKAFHHLYDFEDIEKDCVQILRNHEDAREYFRNNITEILIDESQDNNDIQNVILDLISKNGNNLTFVGDIKQSIYRFRNANPKLFLDRMNEYSKTGDVIELKENFRSREAEVVNPISSIFNNIIETFDVEMPYFKDSIIFGNKALYSDTPQKENEFRRLVYPITLDMKGSERLPIELYNVAKDIKSRLDSREKCFAKDPNNPSNLILRECQPSDFLILARRKSNFYQMASFLEYFDIPSRVIAEQTYLNSAEISFLYNTLYLISSIAKGDTLSDEFKISFISFLRSFVVHESDDNIQIFIKDNLNKNIMDTISTMYPQYLDLFNKYIQISKTKNALFMVNEIIRDFDIYYKLSKLKETEQREIKLNCMLDDIEIMSASRFSLDDICDYFKYSMNQSKDSIKFNSFEESDSATIMTIHASKGLEAPYVYLIDESARLKITKPKYIQGYGFLADQFDSLVSIIGKYKFVLEEKREAVRLAYVALTRARESITITCDDYSRDSFTGPLISIKSICDILCMNNDYSPYDVCLDFEEIPKLGKKNKVLTDFRNSVNIDYSKSIVTPPIKEELKVKHASKELIIDNVQTYNKLARGSLLHSYFEHVNFLSADFEEELNKYSISENDKKYLREFKSSIIFSAPCIRELHELPYYKELYSGVIDYVLEREDQYIIVDFKLKNIDDPSYNKQLAYYKEYLSTRTSKNIKCYLYSIINNELKEVE